MPLHIRQAEVENDEVGLLREVLERRLAARSIEHLVSLRAKPHAEELADGRLVIDHEDTDGWSAHAASSNVSASVVTGRVMVNTAPGRSDRFPAAMVPPMASMKPREIARPSPVPARTRSPFCAR